MFWLLLQNFSYLTLLTAFYYYTHQQWLIIILFSLDNLFISYNTICHIYKLNYKLTFYDLNYVDRYIYYGLLIILKPIIHLLIYNQFVHISYFLFLTTHPWLFNQILIYITPFNEMIKHQCYKLYKLIRNELIQYLLTTICLTALHLNPCLNKKEISYLLKNNYKEYVFKFIKSFILLTILKTLADGHLLTFNMIKKFYNAKAEHQYKDPYPYIEEDLEKIKKIIMKRQWNHFFNPYIIDVLTKLYQQHQNELVVPTVVLFFKKLETATAKLFTVLSIIKILSLYQVEHRNMSFTIGLLSLILIPISKWTGVKLMIKFIGVVMAYNYDNYLLGCFICEYSFLLFNNIVWWCFNKLYWFIYKNYYLLTHCSIYNKDLLLHVVGLIFFKLNYIVLFMLFNAKHYWMTSYFILWGSFSNYDPLHLLLLGVLLYLCINISQIKYAPKPKLNYLLLDNYNKITKPVKPSTVVKYKPIVINYSQPNPIYHQPVLNRINIMNYMHNPKYIVKPL
jgi:hypothetical protein